MRTLGHLAYGLSMLQKLGTQSYMQNHAEVVNEPEPNFISEAGTLHASPKDAETMSRWKA